MALILLPSRTVAQPQQAAQIDWGNPLARGLVFAAIPGGPELVSGVMPQRIGGASVGVNEQGRSFATASNTADGWYWPIPANHPLYSITTADTLFVQMKRAAASAYGTVFGVPYRSGAWANPYYAWGLTANSDPTQGFYTISTNSSTRASALSNAGLFVNNAAARAQGFTRSGSNLRFFAGATQYGSDVAHPGGAPDWSNKQPPVLFNHSSSSAGEGTTGQANVILVWNRELSAAEWRAVSENPWQLFKVPVRRLWYADAGAAPVDSISGTFAVSETADTTAASGAASFASIAGAASSTEGGDTLAAAGGSSFAAISGALACVEGADAASAAGTVLSPISGTMAATEAPDALAAGVPPLVVSGGGGGGAGSVREVRAFAEELDRVRKPTKGEKKRRKQAIEAAVLDLLPDEPAAERVAPVVAQLVARELSPATWAPVHGPRPVTLPPAVVADVHARVAAWLAEQQLLADLEDEFETELLLMG